MKDTNNSLSINNFNALLGWQHPVEKAIRIKNIHIWYMYKKHDICYMFLYVRYCGTDFSKFSSIFCYVSYKLADKFWKIYCILATFEKYYS